MRHFQAKDIQKMVGFPKHRYEYLASKIGIRPEIEEVEETGHVHLYSFKNLLEFAFVHTANKHGLGPKAVKEMLGFLSNNIDLKDAGLFNPKKKTRASVHYTNTEHGKLFKLSGADISKQGRKGVSLGKGFEKTRKMIEKMNAKDSNTINIPGLMAEISGMSGLSSAGLDEFDGYITVNLGVIKDRILKKLAE